MHNSILHHQHCTTLHHLFRNSPLIWRNVLHYYTYPLLVDYCHFRLLPKILTAMENQLSSLCIQVFEEAKYSEMVAANSFYQDFFTS